jgi:hypothetical protein
MDNRILLIAPLTEATGNHTTLQRLHRFLKDQFDSVLCDPSSIKEEKNKSFDCALGIHALHCCTIGSLNVGSKVTETKFSRFPTLLC